MKSSLVSTKILLLFCVVLWGWTFVATKVCLAYMEPITLIGLRFGIGLPLLVIIIRIRKKSITFSRADVPAIVFGSALAAAHFIIQSYGLTITTATNTSWIIAVTPLVMASLAFLLLREHSTPRTITGIVIASVGIMLLISRGDLTNLGWLASIGDWFALMSTFTWAFFTIVTRNLSRRRDPLTVTLLMFTPLTFICLTLFLLPHYRIDSLPTDGILALSFLGIFGTLPQWFWQIGVSRLGAAKAGVFLYLEPVATTFIAIPLLNEPFPPMAAAGGLLVLAGVWWAERKYSSES